MHRSITIKQSFFIFWGILFFVTNSFAISPTKSFSGADTLAGDRFGSSVAISGSDAIIGAPLNRTAGPRSGSAYIFDINTNLETQLFAFDAEAGDQFGSSVAIDGDTAIVGSIHKDISKEGKVEKLDDDGNPVLDPDGNPVLQDGLIDIADSGALYIFRRVNGLWLTEGWMIETDIQQGDWFGYSVALKDNHIAVGAPLDDGDGTLLDSGALHVFSRYGIDWIDVDNFVNENVQVFTLKPADLKPGDWFGSSVSMSANTIVAGAEGSDIDGPSSGAVYVFTRNQDGTWQQQARLRPSVPGSYQFFGHSVSISGNIIIVGAYKADSGKGAAYIFNRSVDGRWSEQAILTETASSENDNFASSVSVSGALAIVGAYRQEINGKHSGVAYLYQKDISNVWSKVDTIESSTTVAFDELSFSLALSDYAAVVGVPAINSTTPGEALILAGLDAAVDTDGDLLSNDQDPDDDNDGVPDVNDTFPVNDDEYIDIDNDGFGDNSDVFIFNATESFDTDNDGLGNNLDTDDDNDGVSDLDEINSGSDPLDSSSTASGSSNTNNTDNTVTDSSTTESTASGGGGSFGPGILLFLLLAVAVRKCRYQE